MSFDAHVVGGRRGNDLRQPCHRFSPLTVARVQLRELHQRCDSARQQTVRALQGRKPRRQIALLVCVELRHAEPDAGDALRVFCRRSRLRQDGDQAIDFTARQEQLAHALGGGFVFRIDLKCARQVLHRPQDVTTFDPTVCGLDQQAGRHGRIHGHARFALRRLFQELWRLALLGDSRQTARRCDALRITTERRAEHVQRGRIAKLFERLGQTRVVQRDQLRLFQ